MQQDVFVDDAITRRLAPINELNEDSFRQLVSSATTCSIAPGEVLQRRQQREWLIYVVSGKMWHLNEHGERRGLVEAKKSSAEAPLFTTPAGDAEAETHVVYLQFDRMLFDVLILRQTNSETEVLDINMGGDDAEIFANMYEAFLEQQLKAPGFPDVLKQTVESPANPVLTESIIEYLRQDQVLSARLIEVANPIMGTDSELNDTVADAVSSIGVDNVSNLLIADAIKKMIDNQGMQVQELLRDIYSQVSELAALCSVLAPKVGNISPARAMQAGLLHSVGKYSIVCHIFDNAEPVPDQMRVESILDRLVEPVTTWLLSEWGMDAVLCDVAENASDWYRPCENSIGLVELVIAAQLLQQGRVDGQSSIALAMTPIGQKLIQLGLSVDDPDGFYKDIAGAVEEAKKLI